MMQTISLLCNNHMHGEMCFDDIAACHSRMVEWSRMRVSHGFLIDKHRQADKGGQIVRGDEMGRRRIRLTSTTPIRQMPDTADGLSHPIS